MPPGKARSCSSRESVCYTPKLLFEKNAATPLVSMEKIVPVAQHVNLIWQALRAKQKVRRVYRYFMNAQFPPLLRF